MCRNCVIMENNKRRDGQSQPATHSKEDQFEKRQQNVPDRFEGMNFEQQRNNYFGKDIRGLNRSENRESNRQDT